MFSTFEEIRNLATKRGISLQKVAEDLNFSVNYLYTLKEKTPSSERLQLIADYFNVSTDYLLGRTDNPNVADDNIGYTREDLREMAINAKTFDGKPLTDDDVEAITNIIEIYLKGR